MARFARRLPDTITQSTLSKAFALLLIEDEIINYFSGVHTDFFFFFAGVGRWGIICHRSHAVVNIYTVFPRIVSALDQ